MTRAVNKGTKQHTFSVQRTSMTCGQLHVTLPCLLPLSHTCVHACVHTCTHTYVHTHTQRLLEQITANLVASLNTHVFSCIVLEVRSPISVSLGQEQSDGKTTLFPGAPGRIYSLHPLFYVLELHLLAYGPSSIIKTRGVSSCFSHHITSVSPVEFSSAAPEMNTCDYV